MKFLDHNRHDKRHDPESPTLDPERNFYDPGIIIWSSG